MTLNDFITLKELLNSLKTEIDSDYSRRIIEIGWPGSKDVYAEAQETLKTVNAVIELAGVYQLNSPVQQAG